MTTKYINFHVFHYIPQGRKWRISEQFQTTSTTVNNNTVYVGDIVQYNKQDAVSYGKIQTFFSKVLDINGIFVHTNYVIHVQIQIIQ